jgi:hypothetical protein
VDLVWFLGVLKGLPIWAIAIAALLAWGQWNRYQAKLATARVEVAQQQAAQATANAGGERDARSQEFEFAERARAQADAYAASIRKTESAAAGLRTERDKLRNILAAGPASSAASSASAACRCDDAANARIVAGECVQALVQVAEAADASGQRLIALQDWINGASCTAVP